MNNGWISLHRKLTDNDLWTSEKFTRGQAWVDLLLLANYADGFIRVRGNRVDIKRGQVGWSIAKLSFRWGWGKNKIRRFLNELENDKQIERQKNNVTSVITICNYDEYQDNETAECTADESTDGTQTDPQTERRQDANNKNNKKNKKNKDDPLFEKAWNLYGKKTDKVKAHRKWNLLSDSDKKDCMAAIPAYVQSTPDKQFRKAFVVYLNGRNWEDEIISDNGNNVDDGYDWFGVSPSKSTEKDDKAIWEMEDRLHAAGEI